MLRRRAAFGDIQRRTRRVVSLAVTLIVATVAVPVAHAGSTIVWNGGTGVFGLGANWVGGTAPGPADTASFTGSTTACSINAPATVGAINLAVNMTLTQSAGNTLTVTKASGGTGIFAQSAGTFVGGNSMISIAGNLNLSTGAFTSTSGILEISGAFNKTGGTFTHNSGRVVLDSAVNQSFATNGATFYDLAINDGLLSYWKLDDTTSPSVDSSGWARSATWAGTATSSNTVPSTLFTDSHSLSIPTATAYATFTNPTISKVTVAGWVRATAAGGGTYPRVLELPGAQVYFTTAGLTAPDNAMALGFAANFSVATGEWRAPINSITYGAWYHIAVTYDFTSTANVPVLYINGVSQTVTQKTAPSGAALASAGTAYIGNRAAGDRYWNGLIDDLRVYNRVLSSSEINSLYVGNQPGTGVAVQTMTGAPTVANDLVLGSGSLSVGSNNLTVSGSWDNYGGLFSAGTGTVTLNSGGPDVIRSAGQPFNNLTLNGSGATWTLEDWLKVNSSLTMTAGALSPGAYAVHASDLNNTAGTLTAGTGTVVIDTRSGVTQSTGFTFNDLRIETPNESHLVAYWKFDEGQGTTLRDVSGTGNDATLVGNTNWVTASLPSLSFDNHAAASFDAITTIASVGTPTSLPANNTAQSIAFWVNFTAITAGDTYIVCLWNPSSSATSVGLQGSQLRAWAWGPSVLVTLAPPPINGWHHVAYTFDGTTHKLYLDGATPNTSTAAPNTLTPTKAELGGFNGGPGFNGKLDDVRIYNVALTTAQVQSLAAGRYAGTGSGATVTLGANLTVNHTLAIDNGTLATSSYTVNAVATDSTKRAYVNAGALQVGSTTATFNGGLTIEPQGTVTENTAGGKIALGTGEALAYYLSGSIQGFPTAAFNWNTFAFWREYVAFNSYVSGGTTADTVLALTADGGAKYSWSLPSAEGSLLGTPRWNMEGANHYIYLVTTTGFVFKVQDTGAALTTVAGWPYHNGASASATSPLANDSSNLYWSGNDGSGNPKIFSLTLGEVLNGTPLTVASTVSAAPVLATIGGTNYVFFAIANHVYQSTLNLSAQFTSTQPTTAVNGRISTSNGLIYFPEDNGKIWGLTASTSAGPTTTWSYQDTDATRHPGGCSAGNQCSVKNIYRDVAYSYSRTCFGDKDGHVYVLNNGSPLAGFPFRPGSSADNFQVAPVSQYGVLLIGAANGNLYEIDENNGAGPALTRTYTLPAAVSSISFSPTANGGNGAYTVGTSDGKLYYVVAGLDPTPLQP